MDAVYGTDMLGEHLARYASGAQSRTLWTPFSPAEGTAMSRDLAMRAVADTSSDPGTAPIPREGRLIAMLRTRFPQLEVRDLTPALDRPRLIKSQREIELIRKSTRLSGLALMEAMRSTVPGISEYELDAVAKYVYYRNGAQGDAYYSLIASGANAGIAALQRGQAQDAGRRVSADGLRARRRLLHERRDAACGRSTESSTTGNESYTAFTWSATGRSSITSGRARRLL